MLEAINWTTVIGIAAFWGAILSTLSLVIQLWEKRKGIKVYFKWGVAPNPKTGNPEGVISLEAVNSGKQMTLKNCFIKLPNGSNVVFLQNASLEKTQFPYTLETNNSVSYTVWLREVMESIIRYGYADNITVEAGYTDALGKDHLSDPQAIDQSIFQKFIDQ